MYSVCNCSNVIQYRTVALRFAILGNFCRGFVELMGQLRYPLHQRAGETLDLNRIRCHY